MMKMCLSILALVAVLSATPAQAGEAARKPRVTTEAAAKMISDLTYTDILRQAWRKGWRFTPEQIESGYRRHFEEFKLVLMDQGFSILGAEDGV